MVQSHSNNRGRSQPNELVALLLSDLVDCSADRDALRETLRTAPSETRLLVCIPQGPTSPLLSAIVGVHVDRQFLLGHEVEKVDSRALAVTAPPGMSRDDLVEFALALSDVVLVSNGHKEQRWARHASKNLRKPLVTVGLPLHHLPSELLDVTSGLDPDAPGWLRWCGRHSFGRLEQGLLEFLALLPWDGESRKNKFLRSFRLRWRPLSYLPVCWEKSCPDEAASKRSHLAKRFEAMDLSALYGSYIHRDVTWAAHLGVAFAVLFAVFGFISEHHLRFALFEFLSLLVAASVVWTRHTKLQERWTACRLSAEQLRIAGMSLPLLVLPRALATADVKSVGDDKVDYEFSALARVKRAVREQGLPRIDYTSLPAVEAARWLRLIVADQRDYHERNEQTLERAEKSLSLVSTTIFFASMFAVSLPVIAVALFFLFPSLHDHTAVVQLLSPLLGHPDPHFLILSAALPAVAAALHGAGVRLGFVHRTALSRDMKKQLTDLVRSLDALIDSAASSTSDWRKIRALAYAAAEAMGAENSSWHRLVRRYRDELP